MIAGYTLTLLQQIFKVGQKTTSEMFFQKKNYTLQHDLCCPFNHHQSVMCRRPRLTLEGEKTRLKLYFSSFMPPKKIGFSVDLFLQKKLQL